MTREVAARDRRVRPARPALSTAQRASPTAHDPRHPADAARDPAHAASPSAYDVSDPAHAPGDATHAATGTTGTTGGRWSGRADEGSGTVLAVLLVAALLAVTAAGLVLGAAVMASHRARLAADVAALAAASAAQRGQGQGAACGGAAQVAAANGARLLSCVLAGADVDLSVAVPAGLAGSLTGADAVARARAGPAT